MKILHYERRPQILSEPRSFGRGRCSLRTPSKERTSIDLLEALFRDARSLGFCPARFSNGSAVPQAAPEVPPFPIGQAHYEWAVQYGISLHPDMPPGWDQVVMEFLQPFWGMIPTDQFSEDPAQYLETLITELANNYYEGYDRPWIWLENMYCGGALSSIIEGLLPPEKRTDEYLILALTEQVYDFIYDRGIGPRITSIEEARSIVREALAYVLAEYTKVEPPTIAPDYLTEIAKRFVHLVGANLTDLASAIIDQEIRKVLYRIVTNFQAEDHPDLEELAKSWAENYLSNLLSDSTPGAPLSGLAISTLPPALEVARAVFDAHISEVTKWAEDYVITKASTLIGQGEV